MNESLSAYPPASWQFDGMVLNPHRTYSEEESYQSSRVAEFALPRLEHQNDYGAEPIFAGSPIEPNDLFSQRYAEAELFALSAEQFQ